MPLSKVAYDVAVDEADLAGVGFRLINIDDVKDLSPLQVSDLASALGDHDGGRFLGDVNPTALLWVSSKSDAGPPESLALCMTLPTGRIDATPKRRMLLPFYIR